MDSGHSGSMQSSSGGDEEYDSHGGSISTFLNSSSPFGSISSSPLTQFPSHQPTLFFDNSHTQNFDSTFLDSTNSPNYNNDLISLRSDPNINNFGNLTSSSIVAQGLHQGQYHYSTSIPIKSSNINQPNVVKNPKKRSRATRRAPTTVLTTDTTNFRRMVQEFTGIPTTPFTGSAYTRRLDLSSSTASSTMKPGHLDNLGPPFTLRQSSTQIVQNSPFVPPSSSPLLSDTLVMPTNNTATGTYNSIVDSSRNKIKSFNTIPSLDEHGTCHEQVLSATLSGYQHQMRTFDGNNGSNNSLHVGKLNCSASSTSEFHPEKCYETLCSAGQGIMGSLTSPSGSSQNSFGTH